MPMAACAPGLRKPRSSSRRLPLPAWWTACHQFPPAEIDPADAGVGFAGDTIRAAYAHAVAQGYRFFSYGDAVSWSAAMQFDLLTTDGAARRGWLTLAHGVVETLVFMPVGTLRDREGDDASIPRRHRRPDLPGQHLPPVAAAGLEVVRPTADCIAS